MTIGRPRPLPGYPTTLALYPISVRRVRVQGHRLPSDPTSRWAPLPSLAVPVITARGGLAPLTSTTCLAHRTTGADPVQAGPGRCVSGGERGSLSDPCAGRRGLADP